MTTRNQILSLYDRIEELKKENQLLRERFISYKDFPNMSADKRKFVERLFKEMLDEYNESKVFKSEIRHR
jgi:hypothetical protein